MRKILDGASASPGARRRSPRAACLLPSRLNAPGLLLVGEGPGLVNVPRLKGIHYAIESGRLAAEAIFAALDRGEVVGPAGRPRHLRRLSPRELRVEGARRGAEHAAGVRQGLLHGRRACQRDDGDEGEAAAEGLRHRAERRAPSSARAAQPQYPTPDGTYTFDKLSSVFASGNRTRDDQPNHVRVARGPADLAEMWAWMCPAQVYEVGEDAATAR